MGRERKLPGVRRAAHLPAVQQRLPGPAALQAKRMRLPAGAGGGACGASLAPVIACWAPVIAAVLTGARRAADAGYSGSLG